MLFSLVRTITLLLASIITSIQIANACDCFYAGEFSTFSKGASIIRGEIKRHDRTIEIDGEPHPTITVTINDVIRGTYTNDKIVLVGDPGWKCFESLDPQKYLIGNEYLFAIFSEKHQQPLLGCGETSLRIADGKVHGLKRRKSWWNRNKIKWADYSIDYDAFVESLKE